MFNLKNKTTLITGCARVIGSSNVSIFTAAGATVYILDRDNKNAADTVDEINSSHHNAFFV
jgi:NAD(P)-dependent dehydrogenase (short-subunit alcohol dehydrogenase family)